MRKLFLLFMAMSLIVSCKKTEDKDKKQEERILKMSIGRSNMILTVTRASFWDGKIGDEIRKVFGEHQVGLPQPETLVSMTQVDPSGFKSSMQINKAVMVVKISENEGITTEKDKYASPQIIVYVTAKDEERLQKLIHNKAKEIIKIFKDEDIKFSQYTFAKNKLNEKQFKTIRDLGISLTIPDSYRVVKDSVGFLWLRQHLKSGITQGDGSNNILVYSIPMQDEKELVNNIPKIRNEIGEKHIPGDSEGMYMITEEAYTPHIFESEIDGKKAYETRGKWEVKGDFMAGPFINYMILDKPKNRIVVFEGFTYAPSVNKRDFIFELEAIGKSIKFKK